MSATATRAGSNLTQAPETHQSHFGSALSSAVYQLRSHLDLLEIETHTRPEPAQVSSIVQKTVQASAFDLEQYAWSRCAELHSDGKALLSREAANSMKSVFRRLIRDNGPTPQVGPTPDKTIEVQWVVGSCMLSAMFEGSGDYNLYATGADDSVLFDVDIDAGQFPSDRLQVEASTLLWDMSKKVSLRPRSFWA